MTLEEQFVRLVADVALERASWKTSPMTAPVENRRVFSRTVYSVGEAISQKGQVQDAKLGAGFKRNPSSGR